MVLAVSSGPCSVADCWRRRRRCCRYGCAAHRAAAQQLPRRREPRSTACRCATGCVAGAVLLKLACWDVGLIVFVLRCIQLAAKQPTGPPSPLARHISSPCCPLCRPTSTAPCRPICMAACRRGAASHSCEAVQLNCEPAVAPWAQLCVLCWCSGWGQRSTCSDLANHAHRAPMCGGLKFKPRMHAR